MNAFVDATRLTSPSQSSGARSFQVSIEPLSQVSNEHIDPIFSLGMARGRKANAPKSICELCSTPFVNLRSHQRACRRKVKVVGDAEELAEHFRAGKSSCSELGDFPIIFRTR